MATTPRRLLVGTVAAAVCAVSNPASAVPWHLDRLDQRNLPLDNTYAPCASGFGQPIYIVSTGIDPTLAEFAGRASVFYDALGGDGIDRVGHGTWLASLAAGAEFGVAKGAQVLGVRAFDDCGRTTPEILVDAFDEIMFSGPTGIIVLPFAFDAESPQLESSLQNLRAVGMIIVAAGGDEYQDACDFFPASSTSTVTIGAHDRNYARAPWAATGGCVDVYGPGDEITATWIGPELTATINTSGASAAIAGGVAAIHRSRGMSVSETEQKLRTCTGTGGSVPLLYLCCDGPGFPGGPGPVAASVPGQGSDGPLDWYRLVDDPLIEAADIDGDCEIGFSDLTALLAGWGSCPSPDETLLAVTRTCDLLELDTATGTGTVVGNVGYTFATAMATDADNRLFMTVMAFPNPEVLILVDPVTAASSVVGSLTGLPIGTQIMAMAFDSSDQLYAIVGGPVQPGILVQVDHTNGSVTAVGETGFQMIWGMTFDESDTLYCVVDDVGALGTIELGTGQVTLTTPPGSVSATDGLAFEADGNLYAAETTLVEIDPVTGVETYIGAIGVDIQDISTQHTPAACPLDLDGNGTVGFTDLTALLARWGY